MSWQAYVDVQLVGTGDVTKAAIISLETKQVWAKSAVLELSSDDVQQLATAFNNLDAVRASGLKVGGVKHLCLNADSNSISLKSLKDPSGGACLYKTNKMVIFGVYLAPIQQTQCTSTVVKVGEYLRDQHF